MQEEWNEFWCYDDVFDERWEWMKRDVSVMKDDNEMKNTCVDDDGNDDWFDDVLWNEMSVWMNMFVIAIDEKRLSRIKDILAYLIKWRSWMWVLNQAMWGKIEVWLWTFWLDSWSESIFCDSME